ncbi:hypothetical protein Hanom_Chr01g00041971 [Helianthus anomalus]
MCNARLDTRRSRQTYAPTKKIGFQDQPDRYVVTTGTDRFDVYGNRNNGSVEYYNHSDAFESWTSINLRELSRAPYHDQTTSLHCKIGWNFFNKLQQQAKVNFKDMKLAESFLLEHEYALDPATNKPFTTVMWPPTKQKKDYSIVEGAS